MTEITMIRRGDTLVPSADMFLDDLRQIRDGREVNVRITQTRHPEQHRLFFAVLGEMVKAGMWQGDVEGLLDYLKIGVGHVSTVVDPSGASWVSDEIGTLAQSVMDDPIMHSDPAVQMAVAIIAAGPKVYLVPKSISFGAMSGDKFNDFFKRVEVFVAERMGIDLAEIIKDVTSRMPAVKLQTAAGNVEPLTDQLTAFALMLAKAYTSSEAFDDAWNRERLKPEVQTLWQAAPVAVRAIWQAARRRSLGKLEEGEFNRVVNEIIDAAEKSFGSGRSGWLVK